MEKNPELLRKAMANILKNPKLHDQSAWIQRNYDEDGGMCGTTMCLAGHVAAVGGGELPPVLSADWDGEWHIDRYNKFRTSDEYAEASWYSEDGNEDEIREVWAWSSEKLGLNYIEREYLFYFFGNAEELAERVEKVATAWENGEDFEPEYY